MKLKQAIDRADNLRPNAFTYEQKTDFINELEHMVQADVMLVPPKDIISHIYKAEWHQQVKFADDRTLLVDADLKLLPYSLINLSELTTTENEGNFLITYAGGWEDGYFGYYFDIDTFTPTTAFESATIKYDGTNEELLIGNPYEELYVSWLIAKIDYYNGDFDRYANTQQAFENHYKAFTKWYANNFISRGKRYAR